MSDGKTIFVLWSGGMDSTYLIQRLLETKPNACVWAYYVRIANNREKTEMELDAIRKMSKVFKRRFKSRFGVVTDACKMYVYRHTECGQLSVWLASLMTIVPDTANEISLGFIMGDDDLSYLSEIQAFRRAFNRLCDKPMPPLTFPLIRMKKEEITACLDRDLLPLVVYCENPGKKRGKFIPCRMCNKCRDVDDAARRKSII